MNDDANPEDLGLGGLSPWKEMAAVVQSVSDLNRALGDVVIKLQADTVSNQPQTEREILRWHASLLKAGLNTVNSQIQALDRISKAAGQHAEQQRSERGASTETRTETIEIK
jgi:hypothetical protein